MCIKWDLVYRVGVPLEHSGVAMWVGSLLLGSVSDTRCDPVIQGPLGEGAGPKDWPLLSSMKISVLLAFDWYSL